MRHLNAAVRELRFGGAPKPTLGTSVLLEPRASRSDDRGAFLAGREWLWPAVVALGLAFVFVAWSYARADAPRGIRLACAALKVLGLAALLACLLEPMWSGERAKPGANVLAVVADNSLSMTLRGPDDTRSRARRCCAAAHRRERNLWRTQLAESFEVRNYLADSRLQPRRTFASSSFDGRTTALGSALAPLAERHRGQPLAGVMLLTDGIAADLDGLGKSAGLPPIYPVVFGKRPRGARPRDDEHRGHADFLRRCAGDECRRRWPRRDSRARRWWRSCRRSKPGRSGDSREAGRRANADASRADGEKLVVSLSDSPGKNAASFSTACVAAPKAGGARGGDAGEQRDDRHRRSRRGAVSRALRERAAELGIQIPRTARSRATTRRSSSG